MDNEEELIAWTEKATKALEDLHRDLARKVMYDPPGTLLRAFVIDLGEQIFEARERQRKAKRVDSA